MSASFDQLGLSAEVLQALTAFGWEQPTPIQQAVVPVALAGRDILGCAQTGTGKTGAFCLPMVERLALAAGAREKRGPRGLVLCPTREIALQTQEDFDHFGPPKGVKATNVIGGASMTKQLAELKRHPAVVIATPGRLIDHLERKSIVLNDLTIVVLDEADRMLDMGFMPQVSRILRLLPRDHHPQTMLFSATLPAVVEQLIRHHLHDPSRIEAAPTGTPATGAEQRLYFVELEEKRAVLLRLLAEIPGTTLIFTRTKRDADHVARFLEKEGQAVACIHSDFSQRERIDALAGFRNGTHRVLVATDIVARGIDVEGIAHVVNFNVPQSPDDYIHRIGRTARATMIGIASTIASPEELVELRAIETHLAHPIPRCTIEGIEMVSESPARRGRVYGLKPMGKRRSGMRARW